MRPFLSLILCALLLVAPPAAAGPQPVRIPALPLTDHDGQTLRLGEVEGIVVLSFMFTTCETLCPVTNAILAALDDRLDESPAEQVSILSITLDPATDTPDVLRDAADAFEASPRWRFLTGEGAMRTAQAFGLSVYDIALHDPVVFIGRADRGLFLRRFGNPRPDELMEAIREVAALP